MSICRLALRICAIEALKGCTGVGENVLNSRHAALDVAADGSLRTNQERPFISVYTEAAIDKTPSFRSLRKNDNLDIVFEFGVTVTMGTTDETGVTQIEQGIPATDEGMEFYLDTIGSDISRALCNPENEWAEMWRQLSGSAVEVERKRVSSEMNGVSLAAQQLRIRVNALADPVRGEKLAEGSAWSALLAMLEKRDHPYLKQIKSLFLETETGKENQRRFGLSFDEVRALFPKKKI